MKEIDCLVHTSADDLRMQLNYYKSVGRYPEKQILAAAHARCIELGYKTKAQHLARVLNQIAKKATK